MAMIRLPTCQPPSKVPSHPAHALRPFANQKAASHTGPQLRSAGPGMNQPSQSQRWLFSFDANVMPTFREDQPFLHRSAQQHPDSPYVFQQGHTWRQTSHHHPTGLGYPPGSYNHHPHAAAFVTNDMRASYDMPEPQPDWTWSRDPRAATLSRDPADEWRWGNTAQHNLSYASQWSQGMPNNDLYGTSSSYPAPPAPTPITHAPTTDLRCWNFAVIPGIQLTVPGQFGDLTGRQDTLVRFLKPIRLGNGSSYVFQESIDWPKMFQSVKDALGINSPDDSAAGISARVYPKGLYREPVGPAVSLDYEADLSVLLSDISLLAFGRAIPMNLRETPFIIFTTKIPAPERQQSSPLPSGLYTPTPAPISPNRPTELGEQSPPECGKPSLTISPSPAPSRQPVSSGGRPVGEADKRLIVIKDSSPNLDAVEPQGIDGNFFDLEVFERQADPGPIDNGPEGQTSPKGLAIPIRTKQRFHSPDRQQH
ncbi:hypothetical protein B0T25DRAFT_359724 [Lasiosphaeria hispida]|uniref:Uncharacterized protein n=1 Tax=Lasiosphaeria hispida TaxID=260671 RepID=A0AAJ0H7K8_9PEZI|nr:hypothetical protein B0T25DRAFT_359724 [Lasiosphaeria hispida]